MTIDEKLDLVLEIAQCNRKKIDEMHGCIYVGNGGPSLKVAMDRNKQKIKLLLWLMAGFYTVLCGTIGAGVLGFFG